MSSTTAEVRAVLRGPFGRIALGRFLDAIGKAAGTDWTAVAAGFRARDPFRIPRARIAPVRGSVATMTASAVTCRAVPTSIVEQSSNNAPWGA